jgi:hypothetical protein
MQETQALLVEKRDRATPLAGRFLHELTGGHPAATQDVLAELAPGASGFVDLLKAAQVAAQRGPAGQRLLAAWQALPESTHAPLRRLLLEQPPAARGRPIDLLRLENAGLARFTQIGDQEYAVFRSWYVEQLARHHAAELGIQDSAIQTIPSRELSARVTEVNLEAYRLIYDIETQARNFLTVQLSAETPPGKHFLEGRGQKYNKKANALDDIYAEALEWQAESQRNGTGADLNPLISYLSTSTLGQLLARMGRQRARSQWEAIGEALIELAPVRNAVMHNQLIDDASFERLYRLQADIYIALNNG